jgi:hypothetical protein
MSLLVLESTGIVHAGCGGTYEPYSDGSMVCFCGAVYGLTVDDVQVSVPVVFLRDEC